MIRILEKHVADKIAAGEVVDRPVSIIKELVENSLDAESSAITVEIRNGGKSYIRVTDNGCGIPSEEAELAFQRHATSKITTVRDLESIETLGFRGEALASICAVSRVELITKTEEEKTGRRIIVEGSSILENTATGCPDGTTITVRDLFYNVPARSKFLASDSAETRRIIDMVSRIALSYPDVKFNMINNNKKVFATRGNGNILNNIISIFGAESGKDLIPLESDRNGYVIKGFVSSPASSSPSRSRQIFCVNGRVVSSDVLEKALDDAYKEKLFHGRYPAAFLFMCAPPSKLDVNVHPTKKEIRFDDRYEVMDFVTEAVKNALTDREAVPRVMVQRAVSSTELLHERQADEVQYSFEDVKSEMTASGVSDILPEEAEVDIKNILSTLREEAAECETKSEACEKHQPILPQKPLHIPFEIDRLEYIGTLFNTYILASDDDSFYMMDQHAAHERVFYERLLAEYNNAEKSRQTLLVPLNFNVSAQVTATEELWLDELSSIGYDIEFFGNNTYLVREIPAFMDMGEAEAFLADMLKALEDKPDLTNRMSIDRIITRSCKSAVKGGDHLEDAEISALMKDLKNCINPFSCPHGRPVFIRMTRYDIEKMFKRV